MIKNIIAGIFSHLVSNLIDLGAAMLKRRWADGLDEVQRESTLANSVAMLVSANDRMIGVAYKAGKRIGWDNYFVLDRFEADTIPDKNDTFTTAVYNGITDQELDSIACNQEFQQKANTPEVLLTTLASVALHSASLDMKGSKPATALKAILNIRMTSENVSELQKLPDTLTMAISRNMAYRSLLPTFIISFFREDFTLDNAQQIDTLKVQMSAYVDANFEKAKTSSAVVSYFSGLLDDGDRSSDFIALTISQFFDEVRFKLVKDIKIVLQFFLNLDPWLKGEQSYDKEVLKKMYAYLRFTGVLYDEDSIDELLNKMVLPLSSSDLTKRLFADELFSDEIARLTSSDIVARSLMNKLNDINTGVLSILVD